MKNWYVVYEDAPQDEVLVEGDIEHFERAAKAGNINGREIRGMWVIDHATEQADVIKIDRRVPPDIRIRYNEWKRRTKGGA